MRLRSSHMGNRHIIILSFGCLTYLIFCDQIKCWKLNATMQSLELPDTLNLNPMMIIIVIPCHSPSKWNWTCRLARSYRDFDCCSFDPTWSLQGESWNFRKQKLLQAINVSHKEKLKLLFPALLTKSTVFLSTFLWDQISWILKQNLEYGGQNFRKLRPGGFRSYWVL